MFQAFRQATRSLRRHSAFCGVVIAVMAVGTGACTAIFSMVAAVFFTPLPYADPDRLTIIWHAQGDVPGVVGLSPGDYLAYRDATEAFESVAGATTRGYNLGGGEPVRVICGRVTPELFPMLAIGAARGRWFTAEEDQTGAPVVVLSDSLWRSHFGGDAGIVGRSIVLDAVPYTVIGIMPASFAFPPPGVPGFSETDCWIPTSFSPLELATPAFDFLVVARLNPEAGFDQAAAEAAAVARRIWESYPPAVQSQVELRARLVPLAEQVVASHRKPFIMFAASVTLLLLIGCANVSNLMLTRLHARRREMALRSALGAPRAVMVKQLLAESMLLAAAGGLGGVMVARAFMILVVAVNPGDIPRIEEARIDLMALVFALACAALAGVLSGLAPAWRFRGVHVAGLQTGLERISDAGMGRDRLRSMLVVGEIGLAVVVLMGAGLLARSMVNLTSVDRGFDSGEVLTFSVALPPARYREPVEIDGFIQRVIDRLGRLPGVIHAAAGSGPPLGPADVAVVALADSPPGAPAFRPAIVQAVTHHYHVAWSIAITQGRGFEPADHAVGAAVAMVNETMARSYWPDGGVVGRQMTPVGETQPRTIVGVVSDVRSAGPSEEPFPAYYVPLGAGAEPVRSLSFVIRTSGDPRSIAPVVRQVVSDADSDLPLFALRTGEELAASSLAPQRFHLFVVGIFAGVALFLSTMGLYAVMTYLVAQSSREFGIRMAMGATTFGIVRLVAGRAFRLLAAGLLAGAAVSVGLSRWVASLLFGVQPSDPTTLAAVILVLVVVSAAAVATPVLRAVRVNPVKCLRAS